MHCHEQRIRVGVISDTHGLLRPEALAFLGGCDRIIHGGDIGGAAILDALRAIAPVTAVRGNNDTASWAKHLKHSELLSWSGTLIYAIHNIAEMDIDPIAAGVRVIVSGHSHKPHVETIDGVLHVNPGSSGPRRFKLPIALAELSIEGAAVDARVVELA